MRTILSLVFCLLSISLIAQTKNDSISSGSSNTRQVWYSFENGEVKHNDLSEWHIAFQIEGIYSSILFNSATGNELYVYPNGEISDWEKVDTNGLSTWPALYNADSSWNLGAFNVNIRTDDDFDLGWGQYNVNTHNILGDSIYIVKFNEGKALKIRIDKLAGGEYFFTYANLDGSDEISTSIKKGTYEGKNFGYYNLVTQKEVDIEPIAKDWDLLFTKYTTMVSMGPGATMPYNVFGILNNGGMRVEKVHPIENPDSYEDYSSLPFQSPMNVIGYNWKKFDFQNSKYLIEDSTVYIIETADLSIWKLILTGYSGSETGLVSFKKELLFSMSTNEPANRGFLEIYPNPVEGDQINIMSSLGQGNTTLTITSGNGQQIESRTYTGGLQQLTISTSHLPSGLYFVSLSSAKGQVVKKFIIPD